MILNCLDLNIAYRLLYQFTNKIALFVKPCIFVFATFDKLQASASTVSYFIFNINGGEKCPQQKYKIDFFSLTVAV